MPDAEVVDFPEPDNGGHIRDRVLDAILEVHVARQMLDTDEPAGAHAVRLHATATRLADAVFELCQDTRRAALDAVQEAGWEMTVDGQDWHVSQEPYGAATLVKGPRRPAPGRVGGRRTWD